MRGTCMERHTAKYSGIQQKSIQSAIQSYSRPSAHVAGHPAGRAGEEAADQADLAHPGRQLAANQQRNYESNLVHGHEAAIRLVDAHNYVCLCCPAPLHNNGMFKTGESFLNVLRHVSSKQHSACVERWVKVKHLMRRLRLFAQVAGRVMLWHTRAVERAYAPGGLGFKEAQADFQAHTSVCM